MLEGLEFNKISNPFMADCLQKIAHMSVRSPMGIIFISSHLSALSLTLLAIVQGCYRKPTRLFLSILESLICHELFFGRTFGLC
jgi:hypothetical protein